MIIGFEHEGEARRFLADMRQRSEKFALSLHPDKTRLIEFGRYAAGHRARRGLGKPETVNFLGFTHTCGRSSRGVFQLKRQRRRDPLRQGVDGAVRMESRESENATLNRDDCVAA
jgi:RNA-directed DNA polymerase